MYKKGLRDGTSRMSRVHSSVSARHSSAAPSAASSMPNLGGPKHSMKVGFVHMAQCRVSMHATVSISARGPKTQSLRWLCVSRLAHAVRIAVSLPCIVSGGVVGIYYHVQRPKARQALLRMYCSTGQQRVHLQTYSLASINFMHCYQ